MADRGGKHGSQCNDPVHALGSRRSGDPQCGKDCLSPASAAVPLCELGQCGPVCELIQHWDTLLGGEVESGAMGLITTLDQGVGMATWPLKTY